MNKYVNMVTSAKEMIMEYYAVLLFIIVLTAVILYFFFRNNITLLLVAEVFSVSVVIGIIMFLLAKFGVIDWLNQSYNEIHGVIQ